MINTGNMAFFHLKNDVFSFERSGTERTQYFCKRQLKLLGMFLIQILFLGVNFAKVATFRCFSFSLMFCSIIYFQCRRNEYVHVN